MSSHSVPGERSQKRVRACGQTGFNIRQSFRADASMDGEIHMPHGRVSRLSV